METTLVAEVLRVAVGTRNYVLEAPEGQNLGLLALRIGPLRVLVSAEGEFWVHYTQTEPRRTVSAIDVLRWRLPAGSLEGQMVLVGSSAWSLMDLRVNPFGLINPGVEVHAQALEMIFADQSPQRPGSLRWPEALAWGLGSLFLVPLLWSLWASVGGILSLGLLGLLGISGPLWLTRGLLGDISTPAMSRPTGWPI